jgi:hypothetical protein
MLLAAFLAIILGGGFEKLEASVGGELANAIASGLRCGASCSRAST